MDRKQINIFQVGPSVPRKPFVAPHPAVVEVETQEGPARLVMDPAAAAVLAEELSEYVRRFSGNESGENPRLRGHPSRPG
jgi:hypothetical protein